MPHKYSITPSLENYLKGIYILSSRMSVVRATDLAVFLSVSKPSVTNAVKELKQSAYLAENIQGSLCLSNYGTEIAKGIVEKYNFFLTILLDAGIEENLASQEACKMEHAISEDSFAKVKNYFRTFKK